MTPEQRQAIENVLRRIGNFSEFVHNPPPIGTNLALAALRLDFDDSAKELCEVFEVTQ